MQFWVLQPTITSFVMVLLLFPKVEFFCLDQFFYISVLQKILWWVQTQSINSHIAKFGTLLSWFWTPTSQPPFYDGVAIMGTLFKTLHSPFPYHHCAFNQTLYDVWFILYGCWALRTCQHQAKVSPYHILPHVQRTPKCVSPQINDEQHSIHNMPIQNPPTQWCSK